MGLFKKKPKKIKKGMVEIEAEFEKGNIVLPTSTKEYSDFNEFKEKTSHLPRIQKQLNTIEAKG